MQLLRKLHHDQRQPLWLFGYGTCSNRRAIPRRVVEERALGGLGDRLMHPDVVAGLPPSFSGR
ncbi:hypothetical protein V6Z72_21760, partial [Cereibacter sphaeroides]